jgi:hypothetical protein
VALFTTGQVVTAAQLNALNGYAVKTADQSVTSSTTLVNDTHLSYAIAATGTYVFDLCLFGVSAANAAGDIAVGFTFPTGTLHVGAHSLDGSLASGATGTFGAGALLSATSGVSTIIMGLSTTTTLMLLRGIFVATATGTLCLQWAQASSNASASTLKAGSHMLVRQVA